MADAGSPGMIGVAVRERVAVLTLDRPPVNAMSDAWVTAFHAALDGLESRDDWTLLHIRSALKAFSAGADLKQLRENFEQPAGGQAEVGRPLQDLFARIEQLPAATLAEIGGAAMGGGLELALACDIRVGAREARLGLPEVGLGLIPGAGGTQRLTHLVGRGVAMRLILGSEIIDGAEAARIGLLAFVFARDTLPVEAAALAARLAKLPRHAMAAAKACIAAAGDPHVDGFGEETRQNRSLIASDSTRALIRAFLDRTPA